MTPVRDLVLNGRFLARPMTGVERLALELGRAIVEILKALDLPETTFSVATMAGQVDDARSRFNQDGVTVEAIGRLRGQAWEQVDLARHRPDAWLLNLCNLAPVARRRQALVVCDAQIYRQPQSYRFGFRLWYRIVTPLLARRACVLFTISEHSRGELEAVGAFPVGKGRILRLGVDHMDRIVPDPTIFPRHHLVKGSYLLAIGSLAPHKNLRMLTDAFLSADVGNNAVLVIAGGGNERVFADAGLPADPRIRYLGRVSDEELRALYEHALAFACPALTEGFGLTPLEAMACGCPVIATTGGAVPEVCGPAALYADPTSIEAWRTAITTMLGNHDLRARLAQAARLHAATFRWGQAAIDFLEVLALHDGDASMVEALRRLRARLPYGSTKASPMAHDATTLFNVKGKA